MAGRIPICKPNQTFGKTSISDKDGIVWTPFAFTRRTGPQPTDFAERIDYLRYLQAWVEQELLAEGDDGRFGLEIQRRKNAALSERLEVGKKKSGNARVHD